MPTNLIATGAGAASSADQVVAAGSSVIFGIKSAGTVQPGNAYLTVFMKDDGAGVWPVATLNRNQPQLQFYGPATYVVTRTADSAPCGAFSG